MRLSDERPKIKKKKKLCKEVEKKLDFRTNFLIITYVLQRGHCFKRWNLAVRKVMRTMDSPLAAEEPPLEAVMIVRALQFVIVICILKRSVIYFSRSLVRKSDN